MILIQYVDHISLLRFKVQKGKVQAFQTKKKQSLCGKLFTFTKTDKLFVCTIRSSFCNSCQISCPPNNTLTLEVLALSFEFFSNHHYLKASYQNVLTSESLLDLLNIQLRFYKCIKNYYKDKELQPAMKISGGIGEREKQIPKEKLPVLHKLMKISEG